MHNRPAPPDAQTLALLGQDLRAALSEVIGGLRLIDPGLLPPAPRGHLMRAQTATEALAVLLEQLQTLLAQALSTQTPANPPAPCPAASAAKPGPQPDRRVLIDIEMPQISGLEVFHRIRSQQMPSQTETDHIEAGHIEPGQFQDLLNMAGPKMAAELLDHLQKDLRTAARALLDASRGPDARGPDWLELRRQSHVMIALAGTAGARHLHQLAQSINALAHQPVPDSDSLHRLLPQALAHLDWLVHFIDQKISDSSQTPPQEQK